MDYPPLEAGPLSQGQLQLYGCPTRHPQPDEAEGGGVEVSGRHQRVKDTPSNGLTTGKGQSLKSLSIKKNVAAYLVFAFCMDGQGLFCFFFLSLPSKDILLYAGLPHYSHTEILGS